MAKLKDVTGARFGTLTAIRYAGYKPGGGTWECACDCGSVKTYGSAALRLGKTRSCGCKTGELITLSITRHGYAKVGSVAREHAIWRGIITRCTNSKRKGFENYGGRGITVAPRWLSFENFIADMGPAPAGMSIDRINNDGNYEPGNCRWADAKTQARNRRKRRYFRRPA